MPTLLLLVTLLLCILPAPASAQTAVLALRAASMGACLETDPDQCLSVSIEQRLDNPEQDNPVGTFLSYILSRFNGSQWVTVQAVVEEAVPAESVRIAANASRASVNLPTIRGVWTTTGVWHESLSTKALLTTPERRSTTTDTHIVRYGPAVVEFEGERYATSGEGHPLDDWAWGSITVGVNRSVVRE